MQRMLSSRCYLYTSPPFANHGREEGNISETGQNTQYPQQSNCHFTFSSFITKVRNFNIRDLIAYCFQHLVWSEHSSTVFDCNPSSQVTSNKLVKPYNCFPKYLNIFYCVPKWVAFKQLESARRPFWLNGLPKGHILS